MKQSLHPTVHPVVYVDTSSGEEFVTTSTRTSNETKDINGVTHYIIRIEISSSSHPFYTGKDRFVDSTGRVDKFKEKMEKAAATAGTRGTKKAKKAAAIAAEQEAAKKEKTPTVTEVTPTKELPTESTTDVADV
jgi:large subunit ribosomal protein L31